MYLFGNLVLKFNAHMGKIRPVDHLTAACDILTRWTKSTKCSLHKSKSFTFHNSALIFQFLSSVECSITKPAWHLYRPTLSYRMASKMSECRVFNPEWTSKYLVTRRVRGKKLLFFTVFHDTVSFINMSIIIKTQRTQVTQMKQNRKCMNVLYC